MSWVLDTNISIYHLGGDLAQPLPTDDVLISIITEIELLSYPSLAPDEEGRVVEFLSSLAIVGLTPEVRDAAIEIRRSHNVKLPDAIIAGTAIALDAVLLTNDRRLAQIPGLRAQDLALKKA